jgi:hypothetical protein
LLCSKRLASGAWARPNPTVVPRCRSAEPSLHDEIPQRQPDSMWLATAIAMFLRSPLPEDRSNSAGNRMAPSDNRGMSSSVRPKRRVGSEAISPGDVLGGFGALNLVSTLQGIRTEPNECNQQDKYRSPLEFARCYLHPDE